MKTFKNIIHRLCRPALLVAVGLALLTSASRAASIEVFVQAYGKYHAKVVPGSGTGGRVIWSPAHYAYITDRVSRGENVWVTYKATYPGEYAVKRGYTTTCGVVRWPGATLPNDLFWDVPTNPSCDNLCAWIQSNVTYSELRLPIGSRP